MAALDNLFFPQIYLNNVLKVNLPQAFDFVSSNIGITTVNGKTTIDFSAFDTALTTGATYTPCRIATTADHSLTGLAAIDGVTPVEGDRILVRAQSTGAENGIYTASSGSWTRAIDFDASSDVVPAAVVAVAEGSTLGDSLWLIATDAPITLDTTSISFLRINENAVTGEGYLDYVSGSWVWNESLPNADQVDTVVTALAATSSGMSMPANCTLRNSSGSDGWYDIWAKVIVEIASSNFYDGITMWLYVDGTEVAETEASAGADDIQAGDDVTMRVTLYLRSNGPVRVNDGEDITLWGTDYESSAVVTVEKLWMGARRVKNA